MDELILLMDAHHSTIKFWIDKKELHLFRTHDRWAVLFDEDDNYLYLGRIFDEALATVKVKLEEATT